MNIIIWDMEVFAHNTLFGAYILKNDEKILFQTWDFDEIRKFYDEHKDNSIWIGHNSIGYDSIILEAIVNVKNEDVIGKIYDKEILEQEINLGLKVNIKDIAIKKNKPIKLFI